MFWILVDFGPDKGFDVRQKLWSVDGAPQLPLLFMWSSPLQCPALKIILTKTEDINPKCSSSSSADISASFRLLKSLLWKIWLLGIWLLRVVGFKESGLPILKIWYCQAVCQRDEIDDKKPWKTLDDNDFWNFFFSTIFSHRCTATVAALFILYTNLAFSISIFCR